MGCWHFHNIQLLLQLSLREDGGESICISVRVQRFCVDYALKNEAGISVAPQSLMILFNYRFPKWGHYSCPPRHLFTTFGFSLICNNLPAVGRLGGEGAPPLWPPGQFWRNDDRCVVTVLWRAYGITSWQQSHCNRFHLNYLKQVRLKSLLLPRLLHSTIYMSEKRIKQSTTAESETISVGLWHKKGKPQYCCDWHFIEYWCHLCDWSAVIWVGQYLQHTFLYTHTHGEECTHPSCCGGCKTHKLKLLGDF